MVRATFAGFSTAFSALQANQKRLDITGQNLANMNTVGYTRQQLQVSSLNYTNPVSHYMGSTEVVVGFGVHMDKVTQIRDPYLDIQYRDQMHKSGYSSALQTSFDELSNFLDESHIDGIHQAFVDIRSTLLDMQDLSKSDPVYESELRTRIQSLTNLLNDSARRIDEAKKNEYSRLDGTGTSEQGAVQRINDLLQQIGKMNRQIKQNQIYGQPSLELMDDRNVLLDELASYIPIEVTYYKDAEHDGLNAAGKEDPNLKGEKYHLDSSGNVIMKKEWPDDLRVTMSYLDGKGNPQTLVLVEGTVGNGSQNYGSLEILNSDDIKAGADPSDLKLKFNGYESTSEPGKYGTAKSITFEKGKDKNNPNVVSLTNQFSNGSGALQASLDMLWKNGTGVAQWDAANSGIVTNTTTGDPVLVNRVNDVKGYDYYTNQLNNLAKTFADVFNTINSYHTDQGAVTPTPPKGQLLSYEADDAAASIGINQDWINSKDPYIGAKGDDFNDTIMDLLEAMKATYRVTDTSNFLDDSGNLRLEYVKFKDLDLENNSFINFMNHVSTVLANDSYANQNTLKTNVTVLNGIQNSRDSISGVSLDEEASNMMMYMSAYNAASRLMTTLDQALDVLINGTGVVGR